MLIRSEKPITKEQYERAQLNNGFIRSEDMADIFSVADLCGYGIYSPTVYKDIDDNTGKITYKVMYTTSDCCD